MVEVGPMTNYTTRKTVWNFWHDHSTESSDSTRPAKLRQSCRNKIQSGLQLSPSVKTVLQRGKLFYESMWRITHHSFRVLYEKCCALHPDHIVSSGPSWDLKPFYVHGASARDIDICCCKIHLHAKKMVQALLSCLKKHDIIPTEFTDYHSFF